VDQSPTEEHCETSKAERGCEKAAAGDGAELHLTAGRRKAPVA